MVIYQRGNKSLKTYGFKMGVTKMVYKKQFQGNMVGTENDAEAKAHMGEIKEKVQPFDTVRFKGVSVTIWKNVRKNEDGSTFDTFSFVPERSYMNDKGEWEKTNSFTEKDVMILKTCLEEAVGRVMFRDE